MYFITPGGVLIGLFTYRVIVRIYIRVVYFLKTLNAMITLIQIAKKKMKRENGTSIDNKCSELRSVRDENINRMNEHITKVSGTISKYLKGWKMKYLLWDILDTVSLGIALLLYNKFKIDPIAYLFVSVVIVSYINFVKNKSTYRTNILMLARVSLQ